MTAFAYCLKYHYPFAKLEIRWTLPFLDCAFSKMPFLLKIWKVIPLLWQHPISFGISKKSSHIRKCPVALAKSFIYQLSRSRRRLSTAPYVDKNLCNKKCLAHTKTDIFNFSPFQMDWAWITSAQQKRASASSAKTLVDLTIQRRRSREETNVQFQSLTSTDKILSWGFWCCVKQLKTRNAVRKDVDI